MKLCPATNTHLEKWFIKDTGEPCNCGRLPSHNLVLIDYEALKQHWNDYGIKPPTHLSQPV